VSDYEIEWQGYDAPNSLIPAVIDAYKAGVSVIPIGADKKPTIYWQVYINQKPTESELHSWFNRNRNTGMGAMGGVTSGGLQILDVEDEGTWTALETLIEDNGLGELWERIKSGYTERAPNGGRHVLYRAPAFKGNTKVARRLIPVEERKNPKEKSKTLIEIRGHGGFAITAPSHGKVHPSGKPYVLERGDFASITSITADEHDDLLAVCRMLDEMPEPVWENRDPSPRNEGEERPGDRYNRTEDWRQILAADGYTITSRDGKGYRIRRAGKNEGSSGTFNYLGTDRLKMFSSSTDLPLDGTHSKFDYYAYTQHNGDFSAAAKALGAKYWEEDRKERNAGAMNAPFKTPIIDTPVGETRESPKSPTPTPSPTPSPRGGFRARSRRLSDVEAKEVDWLWKGWLARGGLSLIGGLGGAGKGTITTNIAAIGSRDGQVWPDGTPAPRFRTLFITAEDSPEHTLRPRLDVHGADGEHIRVMDCITDDTGGEYFFNVSKHLSALREEIIAESIDLVVIDPLTTIKPGSDRNSEGDARDALTPLMKLAQDLHICILGVMHIGKPNGSTRTAAQQFLGSSAYVNMARVVMTTTENDDGEKVFGVCKSNLAAYPPALLWEREDDQPIRWLGKSEQSIDQIMSGSKAGRVIKVEGAEEWLREYLAGGMKPAIDVQNAGKLNLYTDSTLDRAAKRVGVSKWKENTQHGRWWWMLPTGEPIHVETPPTTPDPTPATWTISEAEVERAVANLSTFSTTDLATYRAEVAATEAVGKGAPLARAALERFDARMTAMA
jgi:hypothetical protein